MEVSRKERRTSLQLTFGCTFFLLNSKTEFDDECGSEIDADFNPDCLHRTHSAELLLRESLQPGVIQGARRIELLCSVVLT